MPSCPHLDPSWGHLGPSWGPSWAHLGAILGPSCLPGALLGASLGPPSAFLGHLGAMLATTFRSHISFHPSSLDLGPFWGPLGSILERLGANFRPSWAYLGAFRDPSGSPGACWGSPGPFQGSFPLFSVINRRPRALKRGAAVDRRRRLQSAAPSQELGSRAS